MAMKRICAWCNKFMGEVPHTTDDGDMITHSICAECADNLEFQLGVTVQRYLDSLKIPIVLVDDEGGTLHANAAAQGVTSPPLLDVPEEWPGKIYECAHARLPEKCSNDIHCSGCTIRFAASETYETGREVVSAPALLSGSSSKPGQRCEYHISTKLVDGIVRLRIEKL
jgi:hypothetical protein